MTTDTPPYMNGTGVVARTKELNDALWSTITPMVLIVPPVTTAGAAFLSLLVIGGKVHPSVMTITWPITLLVWITYTRPWRQARRALRQHTSAVEAETAKRGQGWAES